MTWLRSRNQSKRTQSNIHSIVHFIETREKYCDLLVRSSAISTTKFKFFHPTRVVHISINRQLHSSIHPYRHHFAQLSIAQLFAQLFCCFQSQKYSYRYFQSFMHDIRHHVPGIFLRLTASLANQLMHLSIHSSNALSGHWYRQNNPDKLKSDCWEFNVQFVCLWNQISILAAFLHLFLTFILDLNQYFIFLCLNQYV